MNNLDRFSRIVKKYKPYLKYRDYYYYGIGFKELTTEGLAGIAEYNGEHVYHINGHPLVLSKDKKHVFEIQPDMSLKLIDNIRLEEIIN